MKNRSMYVNGSTAYEPERVRENPLTRREYEKLRKSKVEKSNREKLKKNLRKRRTILNIASVFVIGFGIIWSEAQVYEAQKSLNDIKKEISEVNRSNDDLKLQLAKVANISAVKSVAEGKLLMVNPDRSKIVYADLNKDNFSEVPNDNGGSKTKEVFIKLKNLLF